MKYINVFWMLALLISMASCELEVVDDPEDETVVDGGKSNGLDEEKENKIYSTIPKELSIVTLSDNDVEPGQAANLRDYMPSIGDQGRYGTCTSWATGYYTRTIMNARENNLTTADLQNNNNIFSPLDIYLSISHGAKCGGSSIAEAFDTMQKRGIAKMADVPYENLGDCSQSSHASSSEYAPGKIEHYRRVEVKSVEDLKSYLQRGCPIAVGCKLADGFMSYRDGVIEDLDYADCDLVGQHAYHAMCVVGFDNNKGPNGAFCLANSWGKNWGDNGFLWVDYDFFTAGVFCNYGYVIEADKGTKPLVDNNVIDPSIRVDGKDLITICLEDRQGEVTELKPNPGPRDRSVQYNVFNKGNQTISASDDWNILYYYYNAFDPENDFGIIFYDYYTDDVIAVADKGSNGDIKDLDIELATYGQWNWWNYVDVPAGYSVGRALDADQESDMVMDYQIPATLNGQYYFVMFADGFNNLNEQHEQNNFMFFTAKDKNPITIKNGVIQADGLKSAGPVSANINELKQAQPNAYTPEEITGLINFQKKEGILQAEAKRYQARLKSASLPRAHKRFVPAKKGQQIRIF